MSQNETYSEDFVNYKLPEDFEKFVTEIDKLTKQYVNVANAGDTKNPQIIQYFNISDKCEIYELLKHNRSYLSINFLQKKPNHILFKLDPRGQGLHVRTDLFTQIFNNATDARNLDQTIREIVEFFLRYVKVIPSGNDKIFSIGTLINKARKFMTSKRPKYADIL